MLMRIISRHVVQTPFWIDEYRLGIEVKTSMYKEHGRSLSKIQSTHLWNWLNACEKGTYANSVDPDETPQNAASHQVLRCLSR